MSAFLGIATLPNLEHKRRLRLLRSIHLKAELPNAKKIPSASRFPKKIREHFLTHKSTMIPHRQNFMQATLAVVLLVAISNFQSSQGKTKTKHVLIHS